MVEEKYKYMPFKSDGRTKPHSDALDVCRENRELYNDNLFQVACMLPMEELLAQLAEEAAELTQAALKLRRICDGTNPAFIKYDAAMSNLIEEMADVTVCWGALKKSGQFPEVGRHMNMWKTKKALRWARRLAEIRSVENS